MSDEHPTALRTTVLHDWHVANQAKMVPFGGWRMPVHYKTGIIREHLATRRDAGLFDVSHMGRFHIRGPGAEGFLLEVLTNNARSLEPGQAQYTIIANRHGAAVDDVYLYKLQEEDYLLVVNASNRGKDWAWLSDRAPTSGVEMVDGSESLSMLSLQGPHSDTVLEKLIGREQFPENKRNRARVASFRGRPLIVSRTGYTGESVCFELIPEHDQTVEIWGQLVALGATPVGLGARDSLRLEAGLPLYGHEFGLDPEENEIPIFANELAMLAVRAIDEDFIGREALARQREEFLRVRRGELNRVPADQVLARLIQPLAVFGGRRPLRPGHRIRFDGEPVGYVTSGTTVPYSRFYGEGITAVPTDEHDMRPIGLALIDARLRYRSDRPVVLEVEDERGKCYQAELVERNIWPTAPYARTYRGFEAPAISGRVAPDEVEALAADLDEASAANTRWRREECINLIPSEQCTSLFVDALSTADPSGRYNEHNRLRALGPNAPEVRYYKGTAFIMEKEEELKRALRTFFGCSQVEARVVSGQMANDTVYDALKQFKNRHRRGRPPELLGPVLVHDLNKGGHLSAQVSGALKNYVAIDPKTERPAVEHFPFKPDNPHRIDVEAAKSLILRARPELIVFGRSVIIHPEPVREIAEFVHGEFGREDPQRPLIMYDGAHVLGLLGSYFQQPLDEGADIVTGSTHKTFFGPQRGVILSNIEPGSAFEGLWRHIESRTFPGHVSNHHLGTLLGLTGAAYEMLQFKDVYPRQVIDNAKAFSRALSDLGLVVEGDAECDFTETHQVLLRVARAKGEYLATVLEENNVITNPQAYFDDPSFAAASGIRMGTPEMTRYGMKQADFGRLAGLVATIIRDCGERPTGYWRDQVRRFRGDFTTMQYCLRGRG